MRKAEVDMSCDDCKRKNKLLGIALHSIKTGICMDCKHNKCKLCRIYDEIKMIEKEVAA